MYLIVKIEIKAESFMKEFVYQLKFREQYQKY